MRVTIWESAGHPQTFTVERVEIDSDTTGPPTVTAEQIPSHYCGHPCDIEIRAKPENGEIHYSVIDYHETKRRQDTNLCESCINHFATCQADPKFGTGEGNDNVYECNSYERV